MPAPTGQWHVNANGFKGTFTINADPAGNLTGSADIDPGFSDQLVGLWSEAAQEIIFQRVLARGGATDIQTYTGCLFTSKEPLFAIPGQPPDLINPLVGCPYALRCPKVQARCHEERPELMPVGRDEQVAACFYPN